MHDFSSRISPQISSYIQCAQKPLLDLQWANHLLNEFENKKNIRQIEDINFWMDTVVPSKTVGLYLSKDLKPLMNEEKRVFKVL